MPIFAAVSWHGLRVRHGRVVVYAVYGHIRFSRISSTIYNLRPISPDFLQVGGFCGYWMGEKRKGVCLVLPLSPSCPPSHAPLSALDWRTRGQCVGDRREAWLSPSVSCLLWPVKRLSSLRKTRTPPWDSLSATYSPAWPSCSARLSSYLSAASQSSATWESQAVFSLRWHMDWPWLSLLHCLERSGQEFSCTFRIFLFQFYYKIILIILTISMPLV